MNARTTRFTYTWLITAATIGTVVSLYLLVQHTRLMAGIQGSSSFCTVGSFADCDVVNSSRYSEIRQIPVAALGALFYFAILLMSAIAPPRHPRFQWMLRWVGWAAFLGLMFDAYLFFAQTQLHTFCLLCLLTKLMTISIFVCAYLLYPGKASSFGDRIAALLWKRERAPEGRFQRSTLAIALVGAAAFVACLIFLPSFVRMQANQYTHIDNALNEYFDRWQQGTRKTLPVSESDGTFGNPAAKVRLVEFSDFECPHCRKAAFLLHAALRSIEDKVYFVFKHYPLDSSCNPAVPSQMHPMACTLAKLAVCAKTKNKFWDFHDTIFLKLEEEAVRQGVDAIAPSVASIFTREEITRCLQNPKSVASVRENIQQGADLKIRGTPAIFLNGKLVEIPLSVENIRRLVELEEALK